MARIAPTKGNDQSTKWGPEVGFHPLLLFLIGFQTAKMFSGAKAVMIGTDMNAGRNFPGLIN